MRAALKEGSVTSADIVKKSAAAFEADKNIKIAQTDGKFTFSTKDNVEFVEEENDSGTADSAQEQAAETAEDEEKYYCPECGAEITLEMTHCPKCGVEFEFTEDEE